MEFGVLISIDSHVLRVRLRLAGSACCKEVSDSGSESKELASTQEIGLAGYGERLQAHWKRNVAVEALLWVFYLQDLSAPRD